MTSDQLRHDVQRAVGLRGHRPRRALGRHPSACPRAVADSRLPDPIVTMGGMMLWLAVEADALRQAPRRAGRPRRPS